MTEFLILVNNIGYLVEAETVEAAKVLAKAQYAETFDDVETATIVVGSTEVTPVMVGMCIATLRDRNNILLTEESVQSLLGNAHRLRELLLGGYAGSTNANGHLDTMERDYLYGEFAEQVLGLKDWPRMMADKAEMTAFETALYAAEDAGKLKIVEPAN